MKGGISHGLPYWRSRILETMRLFRGCCGRSIAWFTIDRDIGSISGMRRDKTTQEFVLERKTVLKVTDTTALKGAAILSITLHNYFHRLLTNVHENQFSFGPQRVFEFTSAVIDPRYSLQALLTFLGHFGVQIFIFLSAYGLTRKHGSKPPPWAEFVRQRLRKLYPMVLALAVGWVLLTGL